MEALPPPDPHPIVGRKRPPPLVVLAGLTFVDPSSSSVPGCSPPLKGRRHRELPPPRSSSLAGSRWAVQQAEPIVAASSSVLSARPFRAAERASSSLLSLGEALPPPDPHPIGQPAEAGFPPLVVLAGFTFVAGTPRQFSRLARWAAERASSSTRFLSCRLSMGGRQQAAFLYTFVIAAFSRLALNRAAGRACSSSLPGRRQQAASFGTRPCLASRHKAAKPLCSSSASCELSKRTQPASWLLEGGRCSKLHLEEAGSLQ